MNTPVRVLIVEDSPADAEVLISELRRHGYEPVSERVDTRDAMNAALDRQAWHIVIADYSMPKFSAPAAFALLKEKGLDLPFIILSGSLRESAAVEAMKLGADDYVMKSDLSRLIPAIERELGASVVQQARRRAEALQVAILEAALDAVITMDHEGRIIEFNPAAQRIFGYPRSEAMGKTLADLIIPPSLREKHRSSMTHYTGKGSGSMVGKQVETTAMREDGSEFPVSLVVTCAATEGQPLFTAFIRDITEQKLTEEKLARLASFPQHSPNPIIELDLAGNITYANPKAEAMFPELREQGLVHPLLEDIASVVSELQQDGKEEFVREVRAGNSYYEEAFSLSPYGKRVRIFAVDITGRKQLEEQTFQAQKMHAVEQLAGGVAHHFNNIMAGVMGFSELLLKRIDSADPMHRYAEQIKNGARRAASLTDQLLAFSRNVPRQPRALDLNVVVAGLQKTLESMLGDNIRLVTIPSTQPWQVMADAVQMEQLIVHLTANARDAMPDGGKLTIQTANLTLDHESARLAEGLAAGNYVLLAICDTGSGMTEETQEHAFEPFFTTKESRNAAGLGLATCHGIVEQSGGRIRIETEPGKGTAVKVYLPAVAAAESHPRVQKKSETRAADGRTVLLVEDEAALRELAASALRELGCHVLEAGNGEQALRMIQDRLRDQIDMLVTDGKLPKISGKQLADNFLVLYPRSKVLFISGYPADPSAPSEPLDPRSAVLEKPFALSDLKRKVHEMLGK